MNLNGILSHLMTIFVCFENMKWTLENMRWTQEECEMDTIVFLDKTCVIKMKIT